jgi:hypothetical protein
MIADQEGWTSAKVGTLGEHLAGGALTLISVTQGPENLGTATFKIVGAPHMTPYMVSIGPYSCSLQAHHIAPEMGFH